MTTYRVLLYMLDEPDKKLVLTVRQNLSAARKICRDLAGKAWQMERRPDVHTFGNLVLRVEREER